LVIAEVARPKTVTKFPVVLSQDKMACLLDALDNTKPRTLHFAAFTAVSRPLCLSQHPRHRDEADGTLADEGVMRAVVAILALSWPLSKQVKSELTMLLRPVRGATALPA
jgi:hypothetical protein